MAFASMKRCGNCGVVGHNRRTCSVPEHYAAICHPVKVPGPHKSLGVRKKCGGCGEFGHNRRTCTVQLGVAKVEKAHDIVLCVEDDQAVCLLLALTSIEG